MKTQPEIFDDVLDAINATVPYKDDPRFEEERKRNRYCEQAGRPLSNGNIKNLLTGEEQEPTSRNLDDIPPDLGSNGAE